MSPVIPASRWSAGHYSLYYQPLGESAENVSLARRIDEQYLMTHESVVTTGE